MHSRPWSLDLLGGDRLGAVTGTVIKHIVGRAAVVGGATAAFVVGSAALAHPASAEVPQGWPETPEIETLYIIGVLVGVPVLLFVLITLAVYVPGLVRGERVAPGATGPEDQWLGGRRNAGEIAYTPASSGSAGATAETEGAGGGASARW